MSTPGSPSLAPIALKRDEGDALWAFGGLAVIKASSEATDGRVFVVEMLAPRGAGSPLHVHHREDEWFYVTDGELTDRKSTRLNSSHLVISYAVFCLKKKQ